MEYHLAPPFGHAVPAMKEHAISVHFPFWADVAGYGAGASEVSQALRNGYPRTFLHKYVREVSILTYPQCAMVHFHFETQNN